MALIAGNMKQQQPTPEQGSQQGQQPTEGRQAMPPGNEQQGQGGGDEQMVYNQFMEQAMSAMYGDKTSDNVVKMLQSAPSVPEGVAQAANLILSKVYDDFKKQGQDVSDDVLMAAGQEIIALLFELAESAGFIEQVTKDDMFIAVTATMELWAKSHPGMMDMEGMQQELQNMPPEQLRQMAEQMAGGGEQSQAQQQPEG